MFHPGSQPRRDSMMSCLSPNSNYQGSPSNASTTSTQSLGSPMMAVSPAGSTMSSPRYRDNSTALTYTFEQLFNFLWRQHPAQPRQLAPSESYTDLATGQTFTHDQMMAITRPWQPAQSIQSVQHQLQQPLQQQVHTSSNGHNPSAHTYQQMMPLQQQHIQEIQQLQSTQMQPQMMQQTQTQQTQGQQWAQHSLPQQQIQYKKQLSHQTTNTGQLVIADRYGNQWTGEQYREMLRRRQLQMAQVSAAVSPGLQPQMQHVPQVSPPMTASHSAGRPLTPRPHAEALQRQQMNIQSSQVLPYQRSREQPQPALPVMTSRPQQPQHPASTDCQLAQKHLAEIFRVRQAQKSLLQPSKSSNGTKSHILAKSSTQLEAHKQGVRKPQKQHRAQPVPIPALRKMPEATQTVKQTNTAKVKAASNPITPRSCSSTMAPPIRKSDMPSPPAPSGSRHCPSTRASTPASPIAAPSRHTPYPSTTSPCPSACRTGFTMADIEQGTAIKDNMFNFHSNRYQYNAVEPSPHPNTQDVGSPQLTTPTTSSAPTAITIASSPTLTSPRSPSPPHNILTNCTFSLFPPYQEIRAGAYPGFQDYADPHAVVQERSPSRAPEERGMSEERAQLEWEIMVTGGRYAGVPTGGDGEGEGEGEDKSE